MLIEKNKTAKEMSYPLKSSYLQAALESAKITTSTHLIQGGSNHFFECYFWPPNGNVEYERLYIRTSAVHVEQVNEARLFVEKRVIPEFIQWLVELLQLPSNSPLRQQERRFCREFRPNI